MAGEHTSQREGDFIQGWMNYPGTSNWGPERILTSLLPVVCIEYWKRATYTSI